MNKLIRLSCNFIGLIFILSSCEKVIHPTNNDFVDVSFSVNLPQIELGEETIDNIATRTSTVSNAFYVIEVQEYNQNTSLYETIAFGAFDDLSKATLSLSKSKQYIVKGAYMVDFFEQGCSFDGNFVDVRVQYSRIENEFTNRPFNIEKWWDDVYIGEGFYGKVSDFSPTSSNCTIPLESMNTGVKINTQGLNEGVITCYIGAYKTSRGKNFSFDLSEKTSDTKNLVFKFKDSKSTSAITKIEYTSVDDKTTTIYENNTLTYNIGKRVVFDLTFTVESDGNFASSFSLEIPEYSILDEEPQNIDFVL